jgi:hypothetical protein
MASRFAEFATKYFQSSYHEGAIIGSIYGGVLGAVAGLPDEKVGQKACAYALAGYFLPITIAVVGTKYFLEKN